MSWLAVVFSGGGWRLLEYSDHMDVECAGETIATTYETIGGSDSPSEIAGGPDYPYCVALHLLPRRQPLRDSSGAFRPGGCGRKGHVSASYRIPDDETLELAARGVSAISRNAATQVN